MYVWFFFFFFIVHNDKKEKQASSHLRYLSQHFPCLSIAPCLHRWRQDDPLLIHNRVCVDTLIFFLNYFLWLIWGELLTHDCIAFSISLTHSIQVLLAVNEFVLMNLTDAGIVQAAR